jgi:hypothetical protein
MVACVPEAGSVDRKGRSPIALADEYMQGKEAPDARHDYFPVAFGRLPLEFGSSSDNQIFVYKFFCQGFPSVLAVAAECFSPTDVQNNCN